MAEYDFKRAKEFIEENRGSIKSAWLGMNEDWFWTAETIYKDGEFTLDLCKEGLTIGGIDGSDWATPTLEIELMDGELKKKPCFKGRKGGIKPDWFSLGCLSELVQQGRG